MEKIGIEGRGNFYDGVGALRDVGQNHVLQLLALITMDRPNSLNAEDVREARVKTLNQLNTFTKTYRGQYSSYEGEVDVKKGSNTETYFKILAEISSDRWRGVPIILEGGKKIEARKEVVVYFKHKTPCLCQGDTHYKNKIVFQIEPRESITIDFWAKKPGLDFDMRKEKFNYLFRDQRKKIQFIEEYEKLLLDCIMGNQLLFVSTDEVSAMWRFIDPIIKLWDVNKVPLVKYKDLSKQLLKEEGF